MGWTNGNSATKPAAFNPNAEALELGSPAYWAVRNEIRRVFEAARAKRLEKGETKANAVGGA